MTNPETDDPREALAAAARELADAGLLVGTAGNVSTRLGDDRVLVTATGVVLGRCTADDVVETDLAGTVVSGRLKPTSELTLHLDVYRRTFARACVHTHSPAATAVACAPARFGSMPVLHYQQILLGGEIRVAPYATFGTPELAEHVLAALDGRQAALMAHHGAVALGQDLRSAVDHALLVEWLAELLLRVSQVSEPVPLTEEQQLAVITQALERHYGAVQENP
ncbi:class II aldolase/adducin family protein [Aeromicrobium sp. CnD17-E]|uniref:class II aldolase/adducin family protein n=1 Tax=Aeromicrobium sp. CnD17-E TaxID=2954487 RepID=UPI002097B2D1|nr:class II aldolase/adducin family protein [Aeromicrobium sp. CnD17-E]MCO7237623.1 class II aldolase/adducin family protein [Aeromicrobium sp. CnD17-E]